ncbi:MAG: ribonuclease D [Maricaulaceae bacterium]|nr:ribonuclease D [Maricaulaceae bacterium]
MDAKPSAILRPPPLIRTTDELYKACKALSRNGHVAVDTEFMRESTYWPVLCLIQAAGGGTEALIDPLADSIDLAPFYELLADPKITKVFHASRQDLEIFYHKAGGLIPAPLFDTQVAAMAVGLGDSIAYDNLVQAVLKRRLDKGPRFTDWSRRPLSEAQTVYALADVTHLRDLYPELRRKLEDAGRLDWLGEEMRVLTAPQTYNLTPEDAWKRLKIRKNSPKWLAALKAAAAWRELEAQERDTPRSRVMKDDALYEVINIAPQSAEALAGLRAVPKGFERSRSAQRLIEMMRQAMQDPKAFAPVVETPPPPPNGTGPTTELLKVLLKLVAEEKGVAPRLIATVPELEKIAADDDADVPALKGWRRETFGEPALRLKRGELALKMHNGRVVAVDLKD